MRDDVFHCLPPATVLLVLSTILDPAQAYALPGLPRPTTTLPHRALDVVAWPPLPTAPAFSLAELEHLLRRQLLNTVCGYIGGDRNLPATCGAGSHCVLDKQHNAIGCCPNGQASCTTGVFTGCVDSNSGPQTAIDPYVYTCQGNNVCYKNIFDGGVSQYGCGTASNLATTVMASASGITAAVSMPTEDVSFTQSPSSLPTSTTSSSATSTSTFSTSSPTSSSSSTSSSTTTSSSSSSTSSSTGLTTSNPATSGDPSATTAPPSSGPSVDRTGAIVGGTISGVAVLVALIAVGIYMWRRRTANVRSGPGMGSGGSTQYISPMSSHQGFQRLHDSSAGFETGLPPATAPDVMSGAVGGAGVAGAAAAWPLSQQQLQQQQQWAVEGGQPQIGYLDNSGMVRYVENTAPSASMTPNVAYVENPMSPAGDLGVRGATPTGNVDVLGASDSILGNSTQIASPSRTNSIMPTPIQMRGGDQFHGLGAATAGGVGTAMAGPAAVSHQNSVDGSSFYSSSAAGGPAGYPVPPSTAYRYENNPSSVGSSMSMRGGGGEIPHEGQYYYYNYNNPTALGPQQQQQQPAGAAPLSPVGDIDDFSRGFHEVLERIGEEDETGADASTTMMGAVTATSGQDGSDQGGTKPSASAAEPMLPKSSGSGSSNTENPRPLWHQNRRQSRNLMWM